MKQKYKTNCKVCKKQIEVKSEGEFVCGGSCYLRLIPEEQRLKFLLNSITRKK